MTDLPQTDLPLLSPDTIARARQLYDGATPIARIYKFLGMTRTEFLAFRKAQGWPLRAQFAVPPRKPPAWAEDWTEDEGEPPPESFKPEELIARLEDAVGREFARAQRALESKRPKSAEARLRIMASLVKMLAELKRMRRDNGKGGDHAAPEAPGRDINELRAELARRLDRMMREEAAANDSGAALA